MLSLWVPTLGQSAFDRGGGALFVFDHQEAHPFLR